MDINQTTAEEVTLTDVFIVIWESKLLIFSLTSLAAIISIFVALNSDPIFESTALLEYNGKTSQSDKASPGLLGGLSGLANNLMASNRDSESAIFSQEEAIAFLQSREVMYKFFKKYRVAQTLYPDIWDEKNNKWLDLDNIEITDWKLYSNFIRDFYKIKIDQVSKLIVITISFGDPVIAERWCRGLIDTANQEGKNYFNSKMDTRIELAEETLKVSDELVLQKQAIDFITSLKKQKIIENTKPNFLFSYIDEPMVAVQKAAPNRTLMVIMGIFSGGVLSLIIAFGIGFFRYE